MSEYLIISGLIVMAILAILELVRNKAIPQFNIINLFYHIAASSSIILGGYVTSAPDTVRMILILLGLTGLCFGFHLEERPKKTSKKPEVEP